MVVQLKKKNCKFLVMEAEVPVDAPVDVTEFCWLNLLKDLKYKMLMLMMQ
jgi:hypothetical protein